MSTKRKKLSGSNESVSTVRRAKHGWIWTVVFSVLSLLWIAPLLIVLLNSFKRKAFIFKNPFSISRYSLFSDGFEKWAASYENVWDKVKDVAAMENPPKLYFCCGGNDGVMESFLHFKEYAESVGLKATFTVRPGYAHEWRFWELEIQEALRFFGFKVPELPDATTYESRLV